MDALILTCGTGGGHNAAAVALREALVRNGHNAVLFNPYTLVSDQLAQSIDRTYIRIVQRTPWLFGVVYALGGLVSRLPFLSPVYRLNGRMVEPMRAYLASHPFDVCFTSHVFPAEIMRNLRRRGLPTPKTVFVATDYTCVPFTQEGDCDAYITPTAALHHEYLRRGIPEAKLYPLGIPVHPRFTTPPTRPEALRETGLAAGKRRILVSGGSMGAGQITRVVRRLYSEEPSAAELVVICGNNDRLYAKLRARYPNGLVLLRHTDNMPALMRACDLYISKPGGLSSTEAAVLGIPLLHITPIPGCENRNQRFFAQTGMSVAVKRPGRQIRPIAEAYLNSDERRAAMLECQRRHIRKDAAEAICRFAEGFITTDA